jgi:hypothetical protein
MAESRAKKFIRRLEVSHEPGLSHAQLMLMVGLDIDTQYMQSTKVMPTLLERGFAPSTSREEDVGCLELCGLLGRRQFQHQHVRYMHYHRNPFLIEDRRSR